MDRRLALPAGLFALVLGGVALAETVDTLSRLNAQETELSAEQAHNMSQLSRLLSVLEELKRDPPPALLVSPKDAKDAIRAAILVKAMTPELEARARAYAAQAGDMARQRRLAAVESEALFTRDSQAAEAQPLPKSPELALRGPAGPETTYPARAPDSLFRPTPGAFVRRFGDALPSGGRANGVTLAAPKGASVASPGAGLVQIRRSGEGLGRHLDIKTDRWIPSGACGSRPVVRHCRTIRRGGSGCRMDAGWSTIHIGTLSGGPGPGFSRRSGAVA